MRLLKCQVSNFGSYKNLEFNFSESGLTLVSGSTGSGKSTLCDIAPWILYGITAKDGNADDVRAWGCEDPTKGTIEVQVKEDTITVTRIRGRQNDLYYTENGSSECVRGKDLADTQALIQNRLGVSADTYIAGSYFHEFSKVASFFTSTAKDRRKLIDQLADLRTASNLLQYICDERKLSRENIRKSHDSAEQSRAGLHRADRSVKHFKNHKEIWDEKQKALIAVLKDKEENFEQEKQQKIKEYQEKFKAWAESQSRKIQKVEKVLSALESSYVYPVDLEDSAQFVAREISYLKSKRCATCGAPEKSDKIEELNAKLNELVARKNKVKADELESIDLSCRLQELTAEKNPYESQISDARKAVNTYKDYIKDETSKENPYVKEVSRAESELAAIETELRQLEFNLENLEHRHDSLNQLELIADNLKLTLIEQAISELEADTNSYLEKYFDSEIKVLLKAKDGETLDVQIYKNGNPCVYKQLSKGQRQLLKLCFSVSVMHKVANNNSTHFDTLYFDEALDGLDTNLKIKAFSLFEELVQEHSSVYVIDHAPEFHQLFTNRYQVVMDNDHSEISLYE